MKLKLNQTPRKNIASLFLCYKKSQKQKDEGGKAILLPASCDAGKKKKRNPLPPAIFGSFLAKEISHFMRWKKVET
jgi:hypothetical protein